MSEYKCSNCNYTSKTKWNVKNHINRVCKEATLDENIIKVKCEVCSKMFDTSKLLEQHKEKCFEKRTVVVSKFLDPEKIEEAMTNMMTLISSMQKDNKELVKANKELTKEVRHLSQRLEKVEKTNKSGYEDYEDDDNCCDYEENIYGDIESREELFKGRVGWEEGDARKKYQLKVGLNDEIKDGVVTSVAIIVDKVRYVFDEEDKGKGDRLAKALKTVETRYCSEKITCKNIKTSKCFCDGHKS